MVAVGYGVQVLLRTVLSLRKISRQPSLLPRLFVNKNVLHLGAFLGLFSSTFRVSLWFLMTNSKTCNLVEFSTIFFKPCLVVGRYLFNFSQILANKLFRISYFRIKTLRWQRKPFVHEVRSVRTVRERKTYFGHFLMGVYQGLKFFCDFREFRVYYDGLEVGTHKNTLCRPGCQPGSPSVSTLTILLLSMSCGKLYR